MKTEIMSHFAVENAIRNGKYTEEEEAKFYEIISYINDMRIVENTYIFEKFDYLTVAFLKKLENMGLITQRYNPSNGKYYTRLGANAKHIISTLYVGVEYNNYKVIMKPKTLEKVLKASDYVAKNNLNFLQFEYEIFQVSNDIVIADRGNQDMQEKIEEGGLNAVYFDDLEDIDVSGLYSPKYQKAKKIDLKKFL